MAPTTVLLSFLIPAAAPLPCQSSRQRSTPHRAPESPRVRSRRVGLHSSALIRERLRRSKPGSRLQPRKLASRFVFASVGYVKA